MPAQLNHTIVWCRDQAASSRFLTDILGLPPARRFARYSTVQVSPRVKSLSRSAPLVAAAASCAFTPSS